MRRLASWRCPDDFKPEEPILCAEPLVNEAIAQQLGLTVVEPPGDLLVRPPQKYVKREVRLTTAAEGQSLPGRVFLKTAQPQNVPGEGRGISLTQPPFPPRVNK